MRDLFYTTSRPKHVFKSEEVFRFYARSRYISAFGVRVKNSYFKKLLLLKAFFRWYFRLNKVQMFRKVFSRSFLKKRVTFNALAMFFHLLERNVLVLLVRSGLCPNMDIGYTYIKARSVFVNGISVTVPFYASRIGDVVELAEWLVQEARVYQPLYFLVKGFFLFRLLYFRRTDFSYIYFRDAGSVRNVANVLVRGRQRFYVTYSRYLKSF